MDDRSGPSSSKRPRLHVAQSCARCRKRKIKCNGKHPCGNCTKASESCVYSSASPITSGTVHNAFEQQQSPPAELHIAKPLTVREVSGGELGTSRFVPIQPRGDIPTTTASRTTSTAPASMPLDHIREAIEVDKCGKTVYHGGNSGQSFLQHMRQRFGKFVDDDCARDMNAAALPIQQAISSFAKPNWRNTVTLPPQKLAESLVCLAMADACGALVFIHRPSFLSMLNRVCNKSFEDYDELEISFLPLLYAALAVGFIFRDDTIGTSTKEEALLDGARYYTASRRFVDLASIQTLYPLQALVFTALFAAHTGQLGTCYSIISAAQTSALQMGLHRNLSSNDNFIESESKKRTFWVIRRLELTIGGYVGLPRSLSEDDIDQDQPADADDEYITDQKILPMPDGTTSVMAAVNAHIRLYRIFPDILKIFARPPRAKGKPTLQMREIAKIEIALQNWVEELPANLQAGSSEVSSQLERIRYYLRMGFSSVQMTLYRPFLRYISSPQDPKAKRGNCSACATKCITVSRNLIHIAWMMLEKGLLKGEMWFAANATYFATMSLAFCILQDTKVDPPTGILKDAEIGHYVIESMARHSLWAHRCLKALEPVFGNFPQRRASAKRPQAEGPIRAEKDIIPRNDVDQRSSTNLDVPTGSNVNHIVDPETIQGNAQMPSYSTAADVSSFEGWNHSLVPQMESLAYPTDNFSKYYPFQDSQYDSFNSNSSSVSPPVDMETLFQDPPLFDAFSAQSFQKMSSNDDWLGALLQDLQGVQTPPDGSFNFDQAS